MFKCECGNKLNHINYQFWICGKCIKIIDIPVTKNWKNKEEIDIIISNDVSFITHEIRRESQQDFIKLIPDLMIMEVF